MSLSDPRQRQLATGAVRGFAGLGVSLRRAEGVSLPAFANVNPTYAGESAGADGGTWAVNTVLTDREMPTCRHDDLIA